MKATLVTWDDVLQDAIAKGDVQRAFDDEVHQGVSSVGQGVEVTLQAHQVGFGKKFSIEALPLEPRNTVGCHFGCRARSVDFDEKYIPWVLFFKACGFRRARVPRTFVDLQSAVPVAEGQVIQRCVVREAQRNVIMKLSVGLPRESLENLWDATMGDADAHPVSRADGSIEPSRRIAVVSLQQRTREENGIADFDRDGSAEDLDVRRTLSAPPVGAVERVGRVRIVVARQEKHFARKRPKSLKRTLQRLTVERVMLKDIPRDDDKGRLGHPSKVRNALDRVHPCKTNGCALVTRDVTCPQPKLPVGCMDESYAKGHWFSYDARTPGSWRSREARIP